MNKIELELFFNGKGLIFFNGKGLILSEIRVVQVCQVTVFFFEKETKKGKIMARKKLHHGVGSICEVLLKYLHSRPIVAAKYPNATARQRLGGLLCIRQEMKSVNHKQVMCYVFRHDQFEGHELYCIRRWSKVTVEGDPDHFFAANTLEEAPNEQGGATSV
jgi:hypothetical protein